MERRFSFILYFWLFYFSTSIFSIFIYNVNIKFILLNSAKVFTLLFVVASIDSIKEILLCVWFFLIIGSLDLFFNFSHYFLPNVYFNTRNLGPIPWLRIDVVWLAQAVFISRISSFFFKKKINDIALRFFYNFNNLLIIIWLILTISYGIFCVQLRTQFVELILGFVAVILLQKILNIKILLYFVFFIFVGYILWSIFDSNLKQNIIYGLLGRDFSGRSELWKDALSIWINSPIFGHGAGTDSIFISSFKLSGRSSSHNIYLLLLIETGAIGLLFLVFTQFQGIKKEIRSLQLFDKKFKHSLIIILIMHITLLFHVFSHGLIYFSWVIIITSLPFSRIFCKSAKNVSQNKYSLPSRYQMVFHPKQTYIFKKK